MASNVLILGVGGTGCRAVDMLQKKIDRMGKGKDTKIVSLIFDTDVKGLEGKDAVKGIPLSSHADVGAIKERLGEKIWSDFFPSDKKFDKNNPDIGAGQWRKQSYLTLLDLLNDTARKQKLMAALGELDLSGDNPSVLIYTVASLAGGTGSGSFIPLTLYIKKALAQMCTGVSVRARAMLACPDIYQKVLEDNPPQLRSVFANAYAILRELNAINQVVYGKNKREYDNGTTGEASAGRTPVRFRLGSVNSPTGVLFDSLDPAYHNPAAAPFESVCLLEKINGIEAIEPHDEVMANILYSLICTEVGASLNSYLSNEEKGRAGNIGYNRMYSAFATAEIVYPAEEMIEYFAWRKTREDAAGAWLTLHVATKKQVEEKRKKAQAAGRHYDPTTADYAEIFLDQQKAEERAHTSTITDIIREGTVRYEKHGDEEEPVSLLDEYWESLKEALLALVPDHKTYANKIASQMEEVKNPGLFGGSRKADCALQVCEYAKKGYGYLNEYYRLATKEIGDNRELTADAILPLDTKKNVNANPALSFVNNVLKRDGRYIHPVAAMVQLCTFRQLIARELDDLSGNVWKEIGEYEIGKIPTNLLNCVADIDQLDLGKKTKKSAYLQTGVSRLTSLLSESGKASYTESSTDYAVDSVAVRKDCDYILTRLHNEAGEMVLREILQRIGERLDKLIECYRVFFGRFDEQRKELDKKVLKAEEEKSKAIDSTSIFIGASVERRREHYENMMLEAAFNAAASNDVAGLAVFDTTYAMACAKAGNANKEERVNVSHVFDKMYAENKAQIAETPYCLALKDKDIIRAIAEENEGNEAEAVSEAVRTCYNLAKPALRVKERAGASIQRGFLILDESVESYLEDSKSTFGIKREINSHFASALLSATCSDTSVTTTETDNKNVAFLCRATLCVEPSDIVKVNELSGEDGYYKRYLDAIAYAEVDDNDSWLPHLGFNWHKRGYLPFINPELEKAADVKFVKAMLYAIMEAQITFTTEPRGGANHFRYNGANIYLPADNGDARYADENHLLILIDWLRPQEALINQWAEQFDREVDRQMAKVPVISYQADLSEAKTELTGIKYLKMLRRNIFSAMQKVSSGAAATTLKNKLNLSLFEFAKKIQNEEQARDGFDCNDAEKFLKVASDLLWDLCARAADPATDYFANIYQWELGYFATEMYDDGDIAAKNVEENVTALFQIANRAGCFMDIIRNGDGWKQMPFSLNSHLSSGEFKEQLARVKDRKAKEAENTPDAPAEGDGTPSDSDED